MPNPARRIEPRLARRAMTALLAAVAALALAAPAADAVPRQFFGVSAHLPDSRDFELMGEGGIGSVRIAISWRGAQPTKSGGFDWTRFDHEFQQAAANGLRPAPLLLGTPAFIKEDPTKVVPPVRKKSHRRAWQRFVRAALDRYGPAGEFWLGNPYLESGLAPRDWIIWNEQNARGYWRPGANPAEYSKLLRISRKAMNEVAPNSRIIVGGMYSSPAHDRAMNLKPFLKRLYKRKGVKGLVDGVSLHPYGKNMKSVRRQVAVARRTINRAGDRSADLWIGEVGWASGGNRHELVKNKAAQAKLLKRSYSLFLKKRQRWNIRGVFWYVWRDYRVEGTCPWCAKAGLLNKGSDAKPAWNAYRALIDKRT